jgi:site-specific DNA-methyltransferase (adenine-specific)
LGAAHEEWFDRIFMGDMEGLSAAMPSNSVDLLILDPPYNLRRDFGSSTFRPVSMEEYSALFSQWLDRLMHCLKPDATIYVCADWKTSASIFSILDSKFLVRNRISWEREKGRGSTVNWKSTSEDIWFCTQSENYRFYPERVRLRREVIAPYRNADGKPKDWVEGANGSFRDTAPSNLWTDLTVPFWSMPENTEHPTQKPEKLIAKLILASSDEGDVVFDPFLGSGTTAVVAKKLGRKFIGIEREASYAAVSQKRVDIATLGDPIQGYHDGVFWARNTGAAQSKSLDSERATKSRNNAMDLFDA